MIPHRPGEPDAWPSPISTPLVQPASPRVRAITLPCLSLCMRPLLLCRLLLAGMAVSSLAPACPVVPDPAVQLSHQVFLEAGHFLGLLVKADKIRFGLGGYTFVILLIVRASIKIANNRFRFARVVRVALPRYLGARAPPGKTYKC